MELSKRGQRGDFAFRSDVWRFESFAGMRQVDDGGTRFLSGSLRSNYSVDPPANERLRRSGSRPHGQRGSRSKLARPANQASHHAGAIILQRAMCGYRLRREQGPDRMYLTLR
ncbi:hypothetical protein MRB53_039145 [Persea americana]|nr:hypothetical protein MRB53_039145 [Persea americana]